ncbi:intradiol ring-cleavage dioxygenase [Tepidiforma sp.]|uniref:intradiol ring-cleavage dioxygenase n=1 Tax=Tepidiforma sp. TaxID=2682230 RepID=UPI002ADE4723|nr:intradiol ring-cleavage dioxygenase [Tepidiforma sp.]
MSRHPLDHDHDQPHDRGLQFDLQTLRAQFDRRGALKLLGGLAALAVVGCSETESTGSGSTATAAPGGSTPTAAGASTTTATGAANVQVSPIPTQDTPVSACTGAIPRETAGPYPGNGSNGPNALAQSGIVRRDIRSSFVVSTRQAAGVPLDFELVVVDTKKNCQPIAGAAVYAWHCDRDGAYSMYTLPNENYLRGVQATDASGVAAFTSIFPGCYDGRWPHIHFEVYPSLEQATSSANKLITSQLALPEDACRAVYATSGYEQSLRNLGRITLQSDNVFRDGWTLQLAEVTGDASSGYRARLLVGI